MRWLPLVFVLLAGCEGSQLRDYCATKCACEQCDVDDCVRTERLVVDATPACHAQAGDYRACAREHGACTEEGPGVSYWLPGERCLDASRALNACLREHGAASVGEPPETAR